MAVPKGESLSIYGMHDRGGEHLMLVKGQAKGWVLVTEAIGTNPNDKGGSNYNDLADKGFGVIVRLNNAYGESGTIPHPDKYQDFAQRVANFVSQSSGAHIWIIGNEMNLAREQPRKPGTNQPEPITPRLYARCYKMCRDAIHKLVGRRDDQVIVGAIGPWNPETTYGDDSEGLYRANRLVGGTVGDYIQYLRDILNSIGPGNCDGIAVHAYTHGCAPNLVFSDQKMNAPFDQYCYHFRTYRDQMKAIPPTFRHLPVYLTEMDQDDPWEDANKGWVKNAYKEINDWNKAGNQQIRAAILYRWPKFDKWNIDGKRGVQDDFREAVAFDYQWDPSVSARTVPEVTTTATTPVSARAQYQTRYTSHNTPTIVAPGQTLNVTITVQNVGSLTWRQSGANPVQLGFQWYNAAGQMLAFPAQLDFHTPLPADVPPDGMATLQTRLRTPDAPGAYVLRWDLIHEGVTWFTSQGDQGLLVGTVKITSLPIEIGVPTPVPTPTSTLIQIQDISATLPRSTTQPYPTRPRAAIRRIILHHTVTPSTVTVQRIAEHQVQQQNSPGIRCHYGVTAAGQVFQTQPLEVISTHAGDFSGDSVGIYLIGDFTSAPPPLPQLEATAALLAQLALQLGLNTGQMFGYSELAKTASPGATFPTWKGALIARVQNLMAGSVPVPTPVPTPTPTPTPQPTPTPSPTPAPTLTKPIEHYLLMWHRGSGNWARWDLLGAFTYLERFPTAIGFSIEEAKTAKRVTIVGGPGGVPAEAERILQAAGCQVERIAGATETETRQMLEQLAAQGKRFKTLS